MTNLVQQPTPTPDDALAAAQAEARRYREAYDVLGVAFSETAARMYSEKAAEAAFAGARVVRLIQPAELVCYDYWANAGAAVEQTAAGARFLTPPIAWHYAAGAPMDYAGVDFETEQCWLRVRLSGVSSPVNVALYEGDTDSVAAQQPVAAFSGIREVTLPVRDGAAGLLMVRTAEQDVAATGLFLGAELVAAPRPPPEEDATPAADGASDGAAGPAGLRARVRGKAQRTALRLIDRLEPWVRPRAAGLERRLLLPLARLAGWWRGHVTTPRTLWGVTPILTLPLLARCDRLLGLRSHSVVYNTFSTTSAFDVSHKRLLGWVLRHRPALYDDLHQLILRWSLLRYDAFNYFADRGLSPHKRLGLNQPELALIKAAGKRLYTYAYGADVRTRSRTLALGVHSFCANCPAIGKLCICDDDRGARNQQMIARYANDRVAMGDMTLYVPNARHMPHWPLDSTRIRYVGCDWTPERPLRIAHAPNHAYFKGTDRLIAAVERLQREGRAIELVRVQGVPNTEVIKLFESSDIIADQFVAGAYGYTALEAMLVGKPVMCFLRDPSMVHDPDHWPMINVWPESLYQTLKDCLDGRFDLAAIGRRSRRFVEHHFSIEAVALDLGRMYLETAGYPPRIARRIRGRMNRLRKALPPLLPGAPPVPWREVPCAPADAGDHLRAA